MKLIYILFIAALFLSPKYCRSYSGQLMEIKTVPEKKNGKVANFTYEDDGIKSFFKTAGNRIVILNFWIETCDACKAEINALNSLYSTLDPEKYWLVAFSGNRKEIVEKAIAEWEIKYKTFYTSESMVWAMSKSFLTVQMLPQTLIIDFDKKLYYEFWGEITAEEVLDKLNEMKTDVTINNLDQELEIIKSNGNLICNFQSESLSEIEINLYTVLGTEAYSKSFQAKDQIILPVSKYAHGIYFIRFKSKNKLIIKTIVL